MRTARAIAALWVFILAGCAMQPVGDENKNPAPSSSLPMARVVSDAKLWAVVGESRAWGDIAPTSSMVPFLDSRSVALLEKIKPSDPIFKGDIVRFDRGDKPNVLHRVIEVRGDSVFISAYNGSSDGWFPKSAISHRLAGILFSERNNSAQVDAAGSVK